jgi:hypothetical protein
VNEKVSILLNEIQFKTEEKIEQNFFPELKKIEYPTLFQKNIIHLSLY